MVNQRSKLEPTWIGKENWPKLEPVLFDSQDDIDRRCEQLIAGIEGKLQQRVVQERLFSVRWTLA